MISDLAEIMEKYINDPKNSYSVQKMIINLCSSDNGLSVFSTDESLRKATTVSEVFIYISQNCSMYNYEVLQIFINSVKCQEAKDLINDFTAELNNSLLQHLNLLSDNINFRPSQLPIGQKRKLTIECMGTNLKCEDKDLIQTIICEKFGLPAASIQFTDVTAGSTKLIFEISVMVKEHMLQYRITGGVVASFIKYQINRLVIDDEMELKVSGGYDEVASYRC